jgi:HD-GYP domain-containing protein (c-di-GMP phosphodiesterase class II)
MEFVRRHTSSGERILSASAGLARVAAIVRSTHERWDGTGYPDGLAGEAIPVAARIIAVCAAFTAMLSPRPYRAGRSRDEALAEIRLGAGTQFDPEVVRVFLTVVDSSPPVPPRVALSP